MARLANASISVALRLANSAVCRNTVLLAEDKVVPVAYRINEHCSACGECLQICPNDAIAQAFPIFYIRARLCTECVAFADQPQCCLVCPEQAIQLAERVPILS